MTRHVCGPEEARAIHLLRTSGTSGDGIAIAKLGYSEQAMVVLPPTLVGESSPTRRAAVTMALTTHAVVQGGVFPPDLDFLMQFSSDFAQALQAHSVLAGHDGIWLEPCRERVGHHLMHLDLDCLDVRCTGADHLLEGLLHYMTGRRVVLVTSPAEFLAARASKETFESVWSGVGRRWFTPEAISTVSVPNIFDEERRAEFGSVNDILQFVVDRLRSVEFDVALIGASLIGPLIAAECARLGKVGASLGSQLQLLFGVHGRRWYGWPDLQGGVVNDSWVTLPEQYRPRASSFVADSGAYWA